MPAGKQTRCRACNSINRPDIDRLLLGGQSSHRVAKWLAKERGEVIPQPALATHRRRHLGGAEVASEARERAAAAAAEGREAGVKKVVADVTLLDELAWYALDAVRRLSDAIADPTMPQAAAYGAALKEARELVRQREEILSPGGKNRAAPTTPEQRPIVNIIYAGPGDQAQPTPEPGPSAPSAGQ